ncbi:MAG: AAA family ATPase, partial [Cupriavidus sp.]|nr:AAA family ATPase [Cupriavidus sp.]
MSRIDKLTITGYKSIAELRDFELRNLNVLIGANGAGKSNFISLFRMLAEMADERLQSHVQKQGGPDALLHYGRKTTERIHGGLTFASGQYRFDLVPTNDNRLIYDDEQVLKDDGLPGGFRHGSHAESKVGSLMRGWSEQSTFRDWRVYHFH